jgi:5-methylthioadenosine/S-adenosylhomocysteine deaminase
VYAAGGNDVSWTIVNGRVVMEDRRLCSLDVEKVMDDVVAIADEIRSA